MSGLRLSNPGLRITAEGNKLTDVHSQDFAGIVMLNRISRPARGLLGGCRLARVGGVDVRKIVGRDVGAQLLPLLL